MRFAGLFHARATTLFTGSQDTINHLKAAFREIPVGRPFCVANAPFGGFLSNLWSESPHPLPRSAETRDLSFAPSRFYCTKAKERTHSLPNRVVITRRFLWYCENRPSNRNGWKENTPGTKPPLLSITQNVVGGLWIIHLTSLACLLLSLSILHRMCKG